MNAIMAYLAAFLAALIVGAGWAVIAYFQRKERD